MKYLVSILILLSTIQLSAYDYFDMKKKAKRAYDRGNINISYNITKDFISKHPNDLKAQNLLAVLYYWNKEYDKSETVLNQLLSKHNYPEAKKLLNNIVKKKSKLPIIKKVTTYKKANKSKKASKYKDVKETQTFEDLIYLMKYVESNPDDLQSRIILSKYYFKIESYQKSYDLAKESLALDPNQNDMKKILSHLKDKQNITDNSSYNRSNKEDKKQVRNMLKKYYEEKNFNAYFNLYQTLKNSHTKLSKEEYSDALYASIMVGKYEEAQDIIALDVLPDNKNTLQLQMLLAQKISDKVTSK